MYVFYLYLQYLLLNLVNIVLNYRDTHLKYPHIYQFFIIILKLLFFSYIFLNKLLFM
jgi:hypothetical protein